MFKVFASTPESMGPRDIGAHAARAEALGFDGLTVPDAIHDGLLLASFALSATQKLRVATSVLVAFPRSPMVTAVATWDLQAMSGGRFILGLGTQIRQNIEDRYSAVWNKPVSQLREYVQSLRAIFHSFQTGEKLDFTGEHYRFTRLQPFFNPGPIAHPDIPLFCGAVGPDMTRMVGRVADGLITHPTNTAPEYLRQVCLPRIRAGAESAADGPRGHFQLLIGSLIATGRDAGIVAAEREKQRAMLGFLFSTPAYWPSLELFGWQDTGPEIQKMTRTGRWKELPDMISDTMLDTFVPTGTYGDIADILRERYSGLGDIITFHMPEDTRDDALARDAILRLKA